MIVSEKEQSSLELIYLIKVFFNFLLEKPGIIYPFVRYAAKRLIIPIVAQGPLFQLHLGSFNSFLLIEEEFQKQIYFAFGIQ